MGFVGVLRSSGATRVAALAILVLMATSGLAASADARGASPTAAASTALGSPTMSASLDGIADAIGRVLNREDHVLKTVIKPS